MFQKKHVSGYAALLLAISFISGFAGCSRDREDTDSPLECFHLSRNARGCIEKVDKILNLTVVSKDNNNLKAEYLAGFVQGRLQKDHIIAARDNVWDTYYWIDPAHQFPKQLPPDPKEIAMAEGVALANYAYTINYIRNLQDPVLKEQMSRLVFRLLGIYHGARLFKPEELNFSGQWLPGLDTFTPGELKLGYETEGMTFMDQYFVTAFPDLMDAVAGVLEIMEPRLEHCSAFVKKTDKEIFITHNSWFGYLDQSVSVSLYINGDFLTMNSIAPGNIGSMTDFGYNNKGIMFNETSHRASKMAPKTEKIWMLWRATLAEQFSRSLDDFFRLVSLEASGTYLNGYMVADTKTREIGLVEMSYKNFAFFKPDGGGGYIVTIKGDGTNTDYDTELVTTNYILGINFPASLQIRDDLQSTDNRPARRRQFMAMIGDVNDIESAKALVTYTDPANPLSIYGRWDLGYGETDYPKIIPEGSVDAKAVTASMTEYAKNLIGELDINSRNKRFWMKFGTPYVNGKPFIWSESQWADSVKLRDCPDRVDGNFQHLNLYIK